MGVISNMNIAEFKPQNQKRSLRLTSGIRHPHQWPVSDVSSDLTVDVGPASFALHKFPLVSRSGRIRKLILEQKDSKTSGISLSSIPGGPEAFELAAKFCYGITIDFTVSNVAMLRCAAHFLEMTEDYAEKNLEIRAESYLKDTIFPNISNSISVLHKCETLLPVSEHINLVTTLVTAIANNATKEHLSSQLSKLQKNYPNNLDSETPPDWWGNSLTVLNLDFFQRVLWGLKSNGLKQDLITKILINYAHTSLQGIILKGSYILEQRVIVEAMVKLLPSHARKSAVPMAFLSSLLKSAIACSASGSVISDLERRIGSRLDQAILEDILIPGIASNGGSMYDTESVLRIFSGFLNLDEDEDEEMEKKMLRDESEMMYEFDGSDSPKQRSVVKVSKLMDNYLAEVALDSNLAPSKFIALAELLPNHARVVSDGLYRAVDTFLKVHPNIKETEKQKLCKAIDCQKLTQEGCSHAAENERLPVQMAVQVLYYEQIRLRNAMNGGHNSHSHNHFFMGSSLAGHNFTQRSGSGVTSGAISPRDNYASVRRENRELKLEVTRMRMRLTDLEKDHVSMKQEMVKSSHPATKMFKSLAKALGKLNALFRLNPSSKHLGTKPNSESWFFFHRKRCNSVG